MSVVFVILSFVLICLILVHINLHQKRRQLYEFIEKAYKTLLLRHKKIKKLMELIDETELTREIKKLNEETIEKIRKNDILPSQRMKAEIIIEEKVKTLIAELEQKELTEPVKQAIESYKKTQKKLNKNKQIYNELMQEFMDACNIKPAGLYAAFEKMDTDYPKVITE
ncbi:hypothetical protein IJS77_04530 [bacterium]|nr:hypothetical protein [bacterium]